MHKAPCPQPTVHPSRPSTERTPGIVRDLVVVHGRRLCAPPSVSYVSELKELPRLRRLSLTQFPRSALTSFPTGVRGHEQVPGNAVVLPVAWSSRI